MNDTTTNPTHADHDAVDLAIIGGGAAGLAAAIFSASHPTPSSPPVHIAVFDSAQNLGAKILVSGGGRCNVTHFQVKPNDYHGQRNRIKKVLAAWSVQNTIDWFIHMGLELKREPTGKLFPITDSARTVLNALLARCRELDIDIRTQHRVDAIEHDASQTRPFLITHSQGQTHALKIILATGGRSLPKTGSNGHGYKIAQSLGHTITDTRPALVPLVLDDSFFHATLSGIAHETTLTTYPPTSPTSPTKTKRKKIDQRTGSMLWTKFGISGPVAMDASRFITRTDNTENADHPNNTAELFANLLPGETFDTLEQKMIDQIASHPQRGIEPLLHERLPRRVIHTIAQHVQLDASQPLSQIKRETRRALIRALTDLQLPVLRDRGWNYAEVTAGGIPLDEIDTATMQSKITPNLFIIGELLDVDGRIGGLNFQWAWATAHLAGKHAWV